MVGNTLQVYSTQYHVAYVVGNTLQVYSTQYSTVQYTVQYMWLEIHYKCTVQYQVVLSRKEAAGFGLEKKQPNFEKFLQVQIPHTPGVYKRSTNIQNAFKTSDDLSS